MSSLPLRVRLFVITVCSLGAATVLAVALLSDQLSMRRDVGACVALALLVVVGELRPLVITRRGTVDEITLSTAFALALILVGGLWLAALVMCTSVGLQDLRAGKAWIKSSFNAAQYALTLTAAACCFAALTGQPALSQLAALRMPHDLPAALAASLVFFTVNTVLSVTVSALASGDPVRSRLLADLPFQLATSGLLLTFAPLLAFSLQATLWLLPLLVLPMVAIYVSTQAAARRETEALHDSLTGLPNRTLFGVRVEQMCRDTAAGDGVSAAVMMLDLDHFKEINDTLGHHIGDQLLAAVAGRLQGCLRAGDTVARLGGDEFALLAVELTTRQEALDVGRRVLAALVEPFDVDGVQLNVEGSVGIALFPRHGNHKDLLLRQADIALYDAKTERACSRVYDPSADPHTLERLALATDLRAGLGRGQLLLHHQPKVDLNTGSVVGFEALVRWRHPRLGLLMPDQFLPVVENTGLIGPMTLEVLDLALSAVGRWRATGHDVSIAVNLSARHLSDLALPEQIRACLDRHALPADALELEVTETLVMIDPARARRVLAGLRDLGVALAIDDFGTGYSSLAYLRRLQVHELKIDKSFVLNLASSEEDAVIVRSTIELGHNLGLRLVAEGIEDQPAMDLLRSWGCDRAQGYHISRPLPEETVLPWLEQYAARRRSPSAPAGSQP